MKRIIMMLALTALLVVALSMSALSAFAGPSCTGNPDDRKAASCKVDSTGGPSNWKDTGNASFVGHGHKL